MLDFAIATNQPKDSVAVALAGDESFGRSIIDTFTGINNPWMCDAWINYNPTDSMAVILLLHYFEQKDKSDYYAHRGLHYTSRCYKLLALKYYALFDYHDWKTRIVPNGVKMEDLHKLHNEQYRLDDVVDYFYPFAEDHKITLSSLRLMWLDSRTHYTLMEARKVLDLELKSLVENQVRQTYDLLMKVIMQTDSETIDKLERAKPTILHAFNEIQWISLIL